MFSILLSGLVIVVLCFFPVMFVAEKLGAGKSDLIDCIIAVVVGSLASSIIAPMLPAASTSVFLSTIYLFIITGAVYKHLLDTSYIKGFLIAIIPAIVWFVLGLVLD